MVPVVGADRLTVKTSWTKFRHMLKNALTHLWFCFCVLAVFTVLAVQKCMFLYQKIIMRELVFFFRSNKIAYEAHRVLQQAYDNDALNETMCFDWFRRHFEDVDRSAWRKAKTLEIAELEILLDEDEGFFSTHSYGWSITATQSHVSASLARTNIHAAKVLLCIWWDQSGVIYNELLKPNEIITGFVKLN